MASLTFTKDEAWDIICGGNDDFVLQQAKYGEEHRWWTEKTSVFLQKSTGNYYQVSHCYPKTEECGVEPFDEYKPEFIQVCPCEEKQIVYRPI